MKDKKHYFKLKYTRFESSCSGQNNIKLVFAPYNFDFVLTGFDKGNNIITFDV